MKLSKEAHIPIPILAGRLARGEPPSEFAEYIAHDWKHIFREAIIDEPNDEQCKVRCK